MKKLSILAITLAATIGATATDMKDLKIYVNPGHGGYDSDDRNVAVPPFASHDQNGFWESKSNLIKGLDIREMLQGFGADVMMSRTTNTTADDRGLSEIGYEANAYGADFFFSIHSNATGTENRYNQPLMLYRGFTNDPVSPEAKVMAGILNNHLLENQATSWSKNSPWLAGDYDFYDWGVGVGLGVLRKLTVPGMLSEGSHHDYIPETYRLLNNEYCWLEGYHFVKAIQEYFSTEQFSTGVVAGALWDSHLVVTDPIYGSRFFYGHDKCLPVCGATVQLLQGDDVVQTYTTDNLNNGIYVLKDVTPGNYTVKVTHDEYNTAEQAITVTANNVTYQNFVMDHLRNTPPEVVEYSPVWAEGDAAVMCNVPIVLDFNWDMDVESVEQNFSITPAVEGTIRWENSMFRMVFEPKRAYETNTTYTVRINKAAKHPSGLAMTEDFVMQFRTNDYNVYEILACSPSNGDKVHYVTPMVEFRFPVQPNTNTIQNQITIKDEAGTVLGYNARSKRISNTKDDFGYFQIKLASSLEPGKTYTVNVDEEVCDEHGIKVDAAKSWQFTAVDASLDAAQVTAVNTMDDSGVLVADLDNSVATAKLTVARNTSTKIEGTAAASVAYTFNDFTGGNAMVNFATAPETVFTKANMLTMKVYGDLSLNRLNAVFTDGNVVKKVPFCTLDFLGWHSVDKSLADIGEGNFSLTGFEIEQMGAKCGKTGTLYLDRPAIGKAEDAGINAVQVEGLRIRVADDLLVANANCHILGIQLFSLDGKVVKASASNVLNVSDLPAGVFVAKVYATSGTAVQKVKL